MKMLIALAALMPSAAFAHPDHAQEALSLRHVLSEPDHLAMVVFAALVVGTLVWRRIALRQNGRRK